MCDLIAVEFRIPRLHFAIIQILPLSLQARALARTARLGATRLAVWHTLAGGVVERIAAIAVHPELGARGDALAAAVRKIAKAVKMKS